MEVPLGNWLKPEDIGENKELTIEFLDEGEIVSSAEYGDQFTIGIVIPTNHSDIVRKWTPNLTSRKAIAAQYGSDSANWVGKQVTLFTAKEMVKGKQRNVIYVKE